MSEQNLLPAPPSDKALHQLMNFVTPQLKERTQHLLPASVTSHRVAHPPASVGMPPSLDGLDMQWPILNEDLVQLRTVLDTLGLKTAYRPDSDAAIRQLHDHGDIEAGPDTVMRSLDPEVPLYRPCGRRYGSLGVVQGKTPLSDGLKAVLKVLLSLAARSIAERWFRLHHRKAWIVAVAPVTDPGSAILLVLDQQFALQAMDVNAATVLGCSMTASERLTWENFFLPIRPLPSLRAPADVPLRLTAVRNNEKWTAVLTAPDFNASNTWSADALWHARPRCPGLTELTSTEPEPLAQAPSLTTGMRRKIENFIEEHLDIPLPVERLAQAAGMSCSHFTRAFRNALKMTPHRYVMWRRLLRAQDLIRESDASLAEIALVTGFSDQSHLCRLFHLNMGESPSRFRRRCR